MRTAVLLTLLVAFVGTGCAARQAAPPSRDTPTGTVEMFKLYARRGDPSGEWDILSPDFKRRLSQQAGRTVDESDYAQARLAYRGDTQVQMAEKMLQTAIVTQTQPLGPDRARAYVTTSGGPFSKSAWITMVKLTSWELYVHGQAEPYQGFAHDPRFQAEKQPDGSFVIRSDGQIVQTIPAAQVRDYRVIPRWYVDDLGGLERQFLAQ